MMEKMKDGHRGRFSRTQQPQFSSIITVEMPYDAVTKKKLEKPAIFPVKSNSSVMDKSIQHFCQIDPLMFFSFPPKEAPVIPPTLDLHVYPPFAEFIEFGGATKHVLTNAGSSRMVFKVKCSNNSLFKVSPVYAFLDSGASMDLQEWLIGTRHVWEDKNAIWEWRARLA
ncbi:MSP domain protein [Teladorsagia circumcincta]|uniref:Major sperm protein n=1 Tax=Teladorsagia circumcincta TaxID=45464 RepID=A0A2G9UD05_TELCI|nr:MSP domain protein [Teladorsagia circumcincta]